MVGMDYAEWNYGEKQNIRFLNLDIDDDVAFLDDPLAKELPQPKPQTEEYEDETRGSAAIVLMYKILGGASFYGRNMDYIVDLG